MRNIKVKMYNKETAAVVVEADYRVIESAKMIGILKNIILTLVSKTSGKKADGEYQSKIENFIDNNGVSERFEINGHFCEISA